MIVTGASPLRLYRQLYDSGAKRQRFGLRNRKRPFKIIILESGRRSVNLPHDGNQEIMPIETSDNESSKEFEGAVRNFSTSKKKTNRKSFRLREFPIHPVLIATFPIFSLYSTNIDQVQLHEVWHPLGIALSATAVLLLFLSLATRRVHKAAFATSAIVLAFFSYGHVLNVFPVEFKAWTLPFSLCILAIALILIFKTRSGLVAPTVVLNLTAIVLIAPSCLTIGRSMLVRSTETEQSLSLNKELISRVKQSGKAIALKPLIGSKSAGSATKLALSEAKRPDIYYIILDAYGRADSLKYFYGLDNEPFVRALEKRGFYVARKSRANYSQTGYCLPTSLNMEYLERLLVGRNPTGDLFEELRKRIDENEVASFLRKKGYKYVSIWTGTRVSEVKTADLELEDDSLTPPSSFEQQVFGLSAFDATPQGRTTEYDEHRAFILNAFHNLDSVAKLRFQKFVFAHISAPHPPFVFDAKGGAVTPRYPFNEDDGSYLLRRISREEYKSGYSAQLRYVNQRALECVDAILRQSSQPPIIIIQGDHGSRMNLDWESQEKTDLREPYSILNAYYAPQNVRNRLYETITPVNSFRIILSELFGADFPPLPDRSYFSLPSNPLNFVEVTNAIPSFSAVDPEENKLSDALK